MSVQKLLLLVVFLVFFALPSLQHEGLDQTEDERQDSGTLHDIIRDHPSNVPSTQDRILNHMYDILARATTEMSENFDRATTEMGENFDRARTEMGENFDRAKTEMGENFDRAKTEMDRIDEGFDRAIAMANMPLEEFDRIRTNMTRQEFRPKKFCIKSSFKAFKGVLRTEGNTTPLLHASNFKVSFLNEEGIDLDGFSREWASLMAIQLQVSELSIFNSYKEGFYFRRDGKNKEYAKFCGAFLGLAISKELTLDCRFSGLFYHILTSDPKNIQLSLEDMKLIDTTLYTGFSNSDSNLLNELEDFYKDGDDKKKLDFFKTFKRHLIASSDEKIGTHLPREENGEISRSIVLTNDEFNALKDELTHEIFYSALEDTIKPFLDGLNMFIPPEKLQQFRIEDLRKKVEGEFSEINDKAFEKWKAITVWTDCTNSGIGIKKKTWKKKLKTQKDWFWEIVYEFSEKEKRDLVQFWTGSGNIPENLEVIHGGTVNCLPSSHTCVFTLELPYYKNEVKVSVDGIETIKGAKEIMKEMILKSLELGSGGTGYLVLSENECVSIASYNHLDNNDGLNIFSSSQFRSKEISKSDVIEDTVASNMILYLDGNGPDHVVVIKHTPEVGDSKRAFDEYESEIYCCDRQTMSIHTVCEDSLVAVPLMIDLVLPIDLFGRVQVVKPDNMQMHSVPSHLSYCLKAHLFAKSTQKVNSLQSQRR
ncbi:hypothetical protein MDAP_000091 [Mitosporidium daphniae]